MVQACLEFCVEWGPLSKELNWWKDWAASSNVEDARSEIKLSKSISIAISTDPIIEKQLNGISCLILGYLFIITFIFLYSKICGKGTDLVCHPKGIN